MDTFVTIYILIFFTGFFLYHNSIEMVIMYMMSITNI